MTTKVETPNLAARAARWSAARWKTATGAWIAVAVVAALIGGIVGTVKLTDSEQGTGETARGQQMLADAGFNTPAGESVLVQSRSLTAGDSGFRSAVIDVVRGAGSSEPGDRRSRSPYAAGNGGQISADRHSALVLFNVRGDATTASDRVGGALDAVAQGPALPPGIHDPRVRRREREVRALNDTFNQDFANAERLTIPITFVDPARRLRRASSPPGCRCCSRSRRCSPRSACPRSSATSSTPTTRPRR